MSDWIEEIDEFGKLFRVKYLPSGAIIKSEIPMPHTHPPKDSAEMALLKKIADNLGVPY